jgi:hypothetical protein
MDRYEYMQIPGHMIPDFTMDLYKLHSLIKNGNLYVKLCKGMYGLPQASKIAHDCLKTFLAPYNYSPTLTVAGLWKHATHDTKSALVVDDFAVKYTSLADANHLLTALEKLNLCTTNWTGQRYCGLTLK